MYRNGYDSITILAGRRGFSYTNGIVLSLRISRIESASDIQLRFVQIIGAIEWYPVATPTTSHSVANKKKNKKNSICRWSISTVS